MNTLKTAVFLALVPGFMLGVVPVLVTPMLSNLLLWSYKTLWGAVAFWSTGVGVMIWCAIDIVTRGHGTPAPLHPSMMLLVKGLYRFVRNPIYFGALLIQAGNILFFGTLAQVVNWIFLLIGFTLFIHTNEEPYLRRTFGTQYEAYCHSVPRWIPKLEKKTIQSFKFP
jgi:protein-S-isoprenylcysteine O-methyltransferase Ste14